jgi:transmembrane sensor
MLLERVAAGHGSPADRDAVARWIGLDPERRRLFESVERVVQAVRAPEGPTFDAAAGLARARRRLGAGTPAVAARAPHRMSRPVVWSQSARPGAFIAAAAMVVVVGLGVGLFVRNGTREPSRAYATPAGERAVFRLADGTRVVLAPDSRLVVAPGYGAHRRAVSLEGEAFFDVRHDASTPFTVQARGMVATDVGTSFDVTAYPTDSAVRVAVADGRVSLSAGARPAVPLVRGDVAAVGAAGATSVTHRTDIDALTGWTDGRLVFHAVPLRDAVQAISRWYAIDLEVGTDALGRAPLTASFRDEPVAEVLHIVAVTVGARIERRGPRMVLVAPSPTPQ